ncbi:MAG: polyphosphate kinase 2 family protein [Anaerolineales bacterium]|nr:polyphosphate kinase 2 family protein [Anaerolineales bacterium]
MNRYRVKPDSRVDLSEWDPNEHSAFDGDKDAGREYLPKLNKQLESLQELLYAEHKHRLLIILQAPDTGGKDGVIRRVFEGVNPQGVRVASFKVPSSEELDHDYLWRVHKQTPGKGEMVIFNRSHYEDVLVVRVHSLVPKEVWSRRYDHINAFERMLAEEGTTILKFFLHIDPDEQKERLQARLDEPDKHWKFNPDDLKERALWPEYTKAYEDMLSKTSPDWAPWYVVPSNRKWYRDIVIANVLIRSLEKLDMRYPKPDFDPKAITIP